MAPDTQRHRALSAAFSEYLELPESSQAAFIDGLRATDPALAEALQSLIHAHAAAGDFLESPALLLESDATPAGPDPMLGVRLGTYRIERLLGRGGMGSVYLAARDDGQFESLVAIKIITRRGHVTGDDMRRERQILAGLSHPYIAHLVDGGDTPDGEPFLVMQYVDGQPATQYCAEHALGRRERIVMFLKICDAVEHAHRRLVLHLDLKPSNILVSADGVPKLLDFGVAQLVRRTEAPQERFVVPLTPEYASPEQLRGEPVTTASDVYSAGIVLHELLTGQLPGDATHDALGAELQAIVRKATAADIANRYGSMSQLADDLRRYLDNKTVSALPLSAAYEVRTFIRRNRVLTIAGSASLVILALLATFAMHQATVARRERAAAELSLRDLRQLANATVLEFDRSIQGLPGSTEARRQILARGLEYLERAGRNSSDPAVLGELSTAYQRIAELQGNPYRPNIGDVAGAGKSYARAVALREQQLRLPGAGVADQLAYASLLRDESDIFWAAGKLELALTQLTRACELQRSVIEQGGATAERLGARGRCEYSLGQSLVKLGRNDEALVHYRNAAELYADGERQSHDVENAYRIGVANMKVANLAAQQGQHDAAIKAYNLSLGALDQALASAQPTKREDMIRVRAFMLAELSNALLETGNAREAVTRATEALQIAEDNARANGDSQRALNDLPIFRRVLATATLLAGETTAARQQLDRAMAEFSHAASLGPQALDQRSENGVALRYAGDAAQALGHIEEARVLYRRALGMLDIEPRDRQYEPELAVLLLRMSAVASVASEAAAWRSRADATWRSAKARGVRPSRLWPES